MKVKFYQRILILPVLVVLWSVLVPCVASGQEDYIVIRRTTVLDNSEEAGSEGSEFGSAVAVDGSTIAVGAILADGGADNSGAAYLCRITDSDNLPPPQTPLSGNSDARTGDHFGNSLAISGDALVVGARWMDNGDILNTGTAYVVRYSYDEDAETWTTEQKELIPIEPSAKNDGFGYSVAISGNRAVVGTYRAEAVYVFEYNGSDWDQTAKLTVDAAGAEKFGISVAIDGDTLVVGASRGYYGDVQTGSVYVFEYEDFDWQQKAELFADVPVSNDQFGYSVAIEGDTLVVGAPRHDEGETTDSGAAYVFRRNAETWSQDSMKLTLSGLSARAYFGSSVALSGNTMVVGAPNNDLLDDGKELLDAGSAFIFRFDGFDWQPIDPPPIPSGLETNDQFGCAVAISGHIVVVGAHKDNVVVEDGPPLVDAGSVYVFTLNQPPVADAGADKEVEEGSQVTLDGSDSYDPDHDVLSYAWTQIGDPEVALDDPTKPDPTFTAPSSPGENLTLTFKLVVNDGREDSNPAVVEVTVLQSAKSVSEISSVLGWKRHPWGIDKDIYTFQGTEGQKVTVTLRAKSGGKNNNGNCATLKLKDNIRGVSFYRIDSGRLPNQICATLPATGEYQILVAGQPRFFRGKRFSGEYTLTLEGCSGGLEKGAGSSFDHKKSECPAKPHKKHPIWNWIFSRFRH